jgi:phenylpropionate dioxygenase-like ring-hydroxylating dioxygenase large terminal subunit
MDQAIDNVAVATETKTETRTVSQVPRSRFVKNAWYVGLWGNELPAGKMVHQTIIAEPVVFFRKEDGTPAAILDRCPHRFAPLSMGLLLAGDRVQCPYHGLQFAADGQCVENPHHPCTISSNLHLPAFTVVEKYSLIWIWMGDRPADPSDIPSVYSCLDTHPPEHITDAGYINIKAHYELIVNNLLDLSHAVYLHDGSLGNADIIASDVDVEVKGDVITVSRIAKDVAQPGMFKMLGIDWGDSWTSISWYAPSNLYLITGGSPTGQPKETGTGYLGIHLLTPETERTTHYRYTAVRWHVVTEGDELNEHLRQKIYQMRSFAFAEQDKPIIEAQQRLMDDATTDIKPALLSIDIGPSRYKRVLDRLLTED